MPLTIACMVAAALLASSCASSQRASHTTSTPTDAVLVNYRSAVDRAWDPLFQHGNTWSNHCGSGPGGVDDTLGSPRQCRADSVQLKTDAQTAMSLLAAVGVKPELQDRDQALKEALGEMPGQLDLLITSLDSGDVQTQHPPKLLIRMLWLNSWFAVSAIDCWPKGIQRNGAEAQTAFSCVSK